MLFLDDIWLIIVISNLILGSWFSCCASVLKTITYSCWSAVKRFAVSKVVYSFHDPAQFENNSNHQSLIYNYGSNIHTKLSLRENVCCYFNSSLNNNPIGNHRPISTWKSITHIFIYIYIYIINKDNKHQETTKPYKPKQIVLSICLTLNPLVEPKLIPQHLFSLEGSPCQAAACLSNLGTPFATGDGWWLQPGLKT